MAASKDYADIKGSAGFVDRSPKGSYDAPIVPLIDWINRIPGYETTRLGRSARELHFLQFLVT